MDFVVDFTDDASILNEAGLRVELSKLPGIPVEVIAADIPTSQSEFDGQPWRQIIRMRNFGAHQCDDLDPGRVWPTVTEEIPKLRKYLAETVLKSLVE